jgi:ammonium transporter, Amt family
VSGSLAERVNVKAYLVFSTIITGWVYPVIAHWVWGNGWLAGLGYKDAAGSGVIHLTGGVCGLIGAIMCGPRLGRFRSIRPGGDINKNEPP